MPRPYFSMSATLASPALAQPSSVSWLEPELPTPPITSPADLNGHAATQREDVLDIPLRQEARIVRRTFLKFRGWHPEHSRRVRLSSRHLGHLRRALFVPEHHEHLAGAVHDRRCRMESFRLALRERGFGNRLGQREGQIALHHQSLSGEVRRQAERDRDYRDNRRCIRHERLRGHPIHAFAYCPVRFCPWCR